MFGLRKQLLCQAPEENSLEIYNVFPITNFVSHGRRLIVLDNVDHIDQLEKLALKHTSLGPGSRIIIISKDKGILEDYGVNHIYHVQPLNMNYAIQLFYKHAFKGNYIMSEYEKLKYNVLSYLEGHPLLIKVLGRHLAGQDISQWSNALAKLRENPKKDILEMLRISFDALEQNEKEIFLDIACFHTWFRFNNVMEILQFRGFEPRSGLKSLLKKSLITNYDERWVEMPNLLVDLGKYIVKEKSPKEPTQWSRLWDYKDLHKVLSSNEAAKNLEGIIVGSSSSKTQKTIMKVDALSKMNQLKLLILRGVKFSGNLNGLSNELTYLSWEKYSSKCLPSSFQPDNLVELFMRHSKIKRLWKGKKPLPNLKRLNLSRSKNLVEMPNFEEAPNLECIEFEECIRLRKIHPSIGLPRKLTILNLKDCKSLVKMSDFGKASNLERLDFEGCTELRKIHPSVGSLKQLRHLNLKNCRSLVKMLDFGEASNLEWLNFEGCIQLREIHPSVGFLKQLKCLNLKNCKNLVSLPTSILELKSLEYLTLSGCSNLYNTQLSEETRDAKQFKKHYVDEAPIHSQSASSIEKKSFMGSSSCSLLWFPSFPCMRDLDISFCNLHKVPDAIGNLSCLERLNLSGNKFTKMPNLKKLSKLVYINLEHCKEMKYLFELPSQTDFTSGVYLPPEEIEAKWTMMGLNIFNCPKLVESEEWSRMSISWMIQIVQEDLQQGGPASHPFINARIQSVIPGNEIPIWFNNQYVGMDNSISVDSTPLMQHHNNWIGIAFCVVFVPYHEKKSVPGVTGCNYYIPHVLLDVDLVTHMSDHMCLFYLTRSDFMLQISYGTEIQFISLFRDWHYELKRYRYRLVSEQDLQPSNIELKRCKNSSNRKRKFLEINEK